MSAYLRHLMVALLLAAVDAPATTTDEGALILAYHDGEEARNAGRWEQALALFQQAADLSTRVGPVWSHYTYDSYWAMAQVCDRLNRPADALRYFEEAERRAAAAVDANPAQAGKHAVDRVHLLNHVIIPRLASGQVTLAARDTARARALCDEIRRRFYPGLPPEQLPPRFFAAHMMIFNHENDLLDFRGRPREALRNVEAMLPVIRAARPSSKEENPLTMLKWFLNEKACKLYCMGRMEESVAANRAAMDPALTDDKALGATIESAWRCDQAELDGSFAEALAGIEAQIARLRAASYLSDVPHLERNKAVVLARLGRADEALALLDRNIGQATVNGRLEVQEYLLATRAELRLNEGRTAGVEEDLATALQYVRTRGLKKNEPELYRLLGRLRHQQARWDEAARLWEEAAAVDTALDFPLRVLQDLYGLLDVHLAKGDRAAARAAWARCVECYAGATDIPPSRVLAHLRAWLSVSRGLGDAASYAAARQALATAPQRPHWTAYQLRWTNDLPAAIAAVVPAAPAGTAPPADLQPLLFTSRAAGGETAVAFFVLSNPSEQTLTGRVELAGAGLTTVTVDRAAACMRVGAGGLPDWPLTLPPYAHYFLQLEWPAPAPAGTVTCTWHQVAGSRTAAWVISPDARAHAVTVVSGHLLQQGPFYAVPVQHVIRARRHPARADLRAVADTPCRLELRDGRTGRLVAIDANGDGDYEDAGDAVAYDDNLDLHPDVRMPADGADLWLTLLVFPTGTRPVSDVTVRLDVREAADAPWRGEAISILRSAPAP